MNKRDFLKQLTGGILGASVAPSTVANMVSDVGTKPIKGSFSKAAMKAPSYFIPTACSGITEGISHNGISLHLNGKMMLYGRLKRIGESVIRHTSLYDMPRDQEHLEVEVTPKELAEDIATWKKAFEEGTELPSLCKFQRNYNYARQLAPAAVIKELNHLLTKVPLPGVEVVTPIPVSSIKQVELINDRKFIYRLARLLMGELRMKTLDFRKRLISNWWNNYVTFERFERALEAVVSSYAEKHRKLLRWSAGAPTRLISDNISFEEHVIKLFGVKTQQEIDILQVWQRFLHRPSMYLHSMLNELVGEYLGIKERNYRHRSVFNPEGDVLFQNGIMSRGKAISRLLDFNHMVCLAVEQAPFHPWENLLQMEIPKMFKESTNYNNKAAKKTKS